MEFESKAGNMNWKRFFSTDTKSWSAFIVRITVGIVIFPHGAQKLFAWFGGHGFSATMESLTQNMQLPWIIAFLVILIESLGALAMIIGFGTRFVAFSILIEFIGIILKAHLYNGFFMNWAGNAQPEGFEFHLLVIGLCLAAMLSGGGRWSVDSTIIKNLDYD